MKAMSNAKQLMKMSQSELISLGASHGLTFHEQMRKSDMVMQLQASLASGWMEVNAELTHGIPEDDFEYFGGSSDMISDAAHVAQMMASAGMSNSFHRHMSGDGHEMINSYLSQLGVSADDVWMHMPKEHEGGQYYPEKVLAAYMRDTLIGNQEIMSPLQGHYAGDFMQEYATRDGGVQASLNRLGHIYLDSGQYESAESYNRDHSRIVTRLAEKMGSALTETAAVSAMGGRVSYIDSLPLLDDAGITRGILHPRTPLNESGLPLGSYGQGIKSRYSLSASLTDSPSWSDASKAVYQDVSSTLKSLASVYRGEDGMNALRHVTSDRDMILDSASRYADIFDVRHGYENLSRDLAGEPQYSGAAIKAVLGQAHEYNQADAHQTFDPVESIRARVAATNAPELSSSTDFTASLGLPHFENAARSRREAKAIADYDAAHANFRDVSGYGTGQTSGVQYHNFEQGSKEWLDFRKDYDITGSTVGSFLGNNSYTRPWAEMIDRIGLSRSEEVSDFTKKMFERGHATEEATRKRTMAEFGIEISEVGAITNSNYPRMMYSPDGLIGDDALWEHKNPERAGKFADLLNGDHPDYMDQIQLGMHLSGRSRTLFSQTIGDEVRHQWIDKDDSWYERNKLKLESTQGRLAAGRSFMENNPNLSREDMIKGARAAMTGDGIWKDVRQRSNRGFDPDAGTPNDPFIGKRSESSEQFSDYVPNFTMPQQNFPSVVSAGGSLSPFAEEVKRGVVAAQDEIHSKRSGYQANFGDADFDNLFGYGGGGSGGGGGRRGGGGGGGRDWYDPLLNGIQGGSISSASDGALKSLSMLGPWGRTAAIGIGAVGIASEGIETMNNFYGNALDAGMTNSVQYSAQTQGLEMLGLDSNQASRINQVTHSAYNTMLNGDPSGVVRLVKGTRGLITVGDIRQTEGDPVALSRIISERGKQRGWSQARIAGAMEMAGLQGMARTYDRSDSHFSDAGRVVQDGANTDVAGSQYHLADLAADRAAMLPSHNVPQAVVRHGEVPLQVAANATGMTRSQARAVSDFASNTADKIGEVSEDIYKFIAQEESGGRNRYADGSLVLSPTGAMGKMQVLPSTAAKPGYGVKPWDGKSDEDLERVGREYYAALLGVNKGDHRKAMAAYTDGQGTVDKAVEAYGNAWLSAMPAQAQKRVSRYDSWNATSNELNRGASVFTDAGAAGLGTAAGATRINVNINATVNNKQASATVTTNSGETVTQQVNVGNAAMRRK